MSIRSEVTELAVELAELGASFADGDKETAGEYLENIFGIVKEGADFAKIPQDERLKAIMLAFAIAGADVANKAIIFSDETVTP
jgi:hypothetical protein